MEKRGTSLPSGLLIVEFQWMSLELVGDRKAFGYKYRASLMECTFSPLLFLHCRPFFCLRSTWWDGVKEDVCRERERERVNWETGKPRFSWNDGD